MLRCQSTSVLVATFSQNVGAATPQTPKHFQTTVDQVCIPVPIPSEDETLELEVTVGDTTHLMAYRIETVTWGPEVKPDERAEEIRAFLADYNPAWSLVQIGAPGEGVVPITFRKRQTTEASTGSTD